MLQTGSYRKDVPANEQNAIVLSSSPKRKALLVKNVGANACVVCFLSGTEQNGWPLAVNEVLPPFPDNACPPDELVAFSAAGTTLAIIEVLESGA